MTTPAITKGIRKCCEAAQQPHLQGLTHQRDCREQAGDDLRAPEAHLAPRQHVTHEGGRHHQQEDHHAQQPDHLARGLVRGVEEAAEDVQVDHDEEEARPVGVGITQHPTVVDVAHDVLDGAERDLCIGGVVHRQHDAGHDLDHQAEAGEDAEIPHIVEVARHRITGAYRVIDEPRKRQFLVQPLGESGLRFILLGPGETHGVLSA
jgi:hypothetical protein